MKYSFVLPAYKATFLREAIDSILNQTYKDFELIIVNDASPEDLTSIVNSYSDERIQYYVNEKNVGGTDLVAQWNYCITYATGEYLILASDDDVYHLDYLEKMDVLVEKYPDVNVFRPQVQVIDAIGEVKGNSKRNINEFLSQIDFVYLKFRYVISSGVPYYIFKNRSLTAIGGFINFPTAWFSDDATVIRLASNGVVIHPEVLFSFRDSGLNISGALNNSQILYYKLSATESFFSWLSTELKSMNIVGLADQTKKNFIKTHLRSEMLMYMSWEIGCSDRRTLYLSWKQLSKMKTLSLLEFLSIYVRVFKTKIRARLSSNRC